MGVVTGLVTVMTPVGGGRAWREVWPRESQDGAVDTKPQYEQGEQVVMDGVLRGQGTEGSLVRGAGATGKAVLRGGQVSRRGGTAQGQGRLPLSTPPLHVAVNGRMEVWQQLEKQMSQGKTFSKDQGVCD